MDSYQIFVRMFRQAAGTRNYSTLADVLNDGWRHFQIVSTEHYESVVCSVFDRSDGLLCFLEYELETSVQTRNKLLDNALKEGFIFLQFFIENFYAAPCFMQYIKQIKDVCELALFKKCSLYIKKTACFSFVKLIALFKEHDDKLQLVETLDKFVRNFHVHTEKERKWILCVVCKMIKYHGNICPSQRYVDHIFQQLCKDTKFEYKLRYGMSEEFYIYLDSFADMLEDVTPANKSIFCNLYTWIKAICRPDQQYSKIVLGSAIDLLSAHMSEFRDLVYPDYNYWCNVLWQLSYEDITYKKRNKEKYISAGAQCALKSFYRIMGRMLTDQNKENSKDIVLYLLRDFHRRFRNANSNFITLQLSVYGFSKLAAALTIHECNFDVKQMYSSLTSCALSIASSEQSTEPQIEEVCCYQNAISEMSNMFDMTIGKINVLIKLSTYIIKRFPDLTVDSNNNLAVSSLIKAISNLESKSLLQQYLDNTVHDGIVWSCSHTLALDAELQQDLQQPPICYKNYLPLWTELLNVERYRANEQRHLVEQVADTLMNVCIALINRLDIRVKRTDKEIVLSNLAFTHSAINQTDFRVFVNLVDLYVDIVNTSEPSLFTNTMHKFLYEVIRLSYKHPLIPGFYKLARIGIIILTYMLEEEKERRERYNEEQEQQNQTSGGELRRTEELLSNYLIHILDLIPTFSNELLIACLQLILDARVAYVENALPRTLPAFKIAFTIGLSNLELAYDALIALETWTRKRERTDELLREIVPYLEPYLRSTESSVEISQDLTRAAATRKRVKRVDVIDTERTLRSLQRRILLFLGSLGQDLLVSFVHERASRSTGASWDRKDLIKYALPLPDAQPDICFDRMLPRVIALARDSSDRRTKIAACEVLHSIVTIVIGLTKRHLMENRFVALYGVLCPTLLLLGSDSDEVVGSLFRPLVLQLMRWTSEIMRIPNMQNMGEHVVNSLFHGLTDDSNSALREFSGMCLAELTDRSIGETEDDKKEANMIIQRINDLALHPSVRKRVAAAVAFNHLHAVFSKYDAIISTYWLEIFYHFVRSLDGCDDLSIVNALAHIEKVMKSKADILNGVREDRRKPHEFDDATLNHALYWLLLQCGNVNEHCRAKCMELYINISQSVTGSAQETTRAIVKIYGIKRLIEVVQRGLESNITDISATGNVTSLLKALDCYVWLIEKRLLTVEELFPANGEHEIFPYIRSFVHEVWQAIGDRNDAEVTTRNDETGFRELEYLQRKLRCKTLMTVFDFLRELLPSNVNVLQEFFLDKTSPKTQQSPLTSLTIKCIMHPRVVGFDMKNIEMMDKLPRVLEGLLKSMKSTCADVLSKILKTHFSRSIQDYVTKLLNLHDIAEDESCDELLQHVNGLVMLTRCDVLDVSFLESSVLANHERTVKQIFQFLIKERIGEWICTDLSGPMIEYLQALMEFQLSHEEVSMLVSDDTRSMTEILIELISNDTQVLDIYSTKIAHGEYFLNMFKNVIYRYMLTHVGAIAFMFDTMSRENPFFLLKWIEDMLLFLRRHKCELQDYVDTTVDAILKHFTCLENAVCNIDSRKERLMNIYGIAVRLKSRPTELNQVSPGLHKNILNQLTDDGGIEFKTQLLRNFFVCFTNNLMDSGEGSSELRIILRNLKIQARSLYGNQTPKTDANAIKVIDCFEMMLVLMSTSRSLMTLECVMHFVAGYEDCLLNDKLREHLYRYYQEASSDHALRSLEMTYRRFMGTMDAVETERLELLRGFLLPAFEFCDAATIERFFGRNIHELYTIADQSVTVTNDDSNDAHLAHNLVSKIGCFQLITIMFAKVNVEQIIGVNSTIGQNVIRSIRKQIDTEKQIFVSLLNVTKNTRPLKITRPRCNELVRRLQCSAYNCSLAMITAKNDECYYRYAFGENSRGFFIWKNIVNCDKVHDFGKVFKTYAQTREITVNIRSTVDVDERRPLGHTYTYSYNLSGSTLHEDINAYDLNKCALLPYGTSAANRQLPDSSHVRASIALESGDFNEHECMSYICVFLRHISKNSTNATLWLQEFLKALLHDQRNVRLFILKIISNTADEVFKPHAKSMLTSVMTAVIDYMEKNCLNYIIVDILEVLTSWHDVAPPTVSDDRAKAQTLFEMFLEKVSSEDCKRDEYNYNLSLKTIVEKWHSCLQVPTGILTREKMSSAPKSAVQLILVFLENDMAGQIIARDDIVEFLMSMLRDWKSTDTKKILLSCRCLGLYLKSLENSDRNDKKDRGGKMRDEIKAILGKIQPYQSIANQVKRVAFLCRANPQVAVDYVEVLTSAMAKDIERPYCLEVYALAIQQLDAQTVMDNLRSLKLQSVLANRTPFCEETGLKIVRSTVTIVSPADQLPYVNVAVSYMKDSRTERRELVYDILMNVYKRYSAGAARDDEDVRTLLSISERNLIAGLLDPSEDLQERILRFWMEETDLRTERSKELLLALLQKLSSQTMITSEDAFASFIVVLMLQLATKSVNYTKKIFDSPLSDSSCAFKDYSVSVSWQRQNLSCMTPMFVNSLASQLNYSITLSQSGDNSLYNSLEAASLRSLQNTSSRSRPMQDVEDGAFDDNDIAIDASTSGALLLDTELGRTGSSANRSMVQSAPSRNRKFRRFHADSSDAYRRRQMRKNVQQTEMMRQENIRQRNTIKLYRSYRNGDFPDIEICHSSLIKPLVQLIKLDRLICKDMSVSLFCSLVRQEKKEKSKDFRELVVNDLKRLLYQSDERNGPFNAVILETLLQLNVTDCNPRDIALVSKTNSLNVIGALLIEQSLSQDDDDRNDVSPSPSKKMRTTHDDDVTEKTAKWTHLASLYKSLNDVDVVLSIFRKRPFFDEDVQVAAVSEVDGNWKQTSDAFERACKNSTMISPIKEHCLQGLFKAVDNLCNWSKIDELAKKHASGNLSNIWDDAWRDWILPYVCEAYVHLSTLSEDGHSLLKKEDKTVIYSWMRDPKKLEHLKPIVGEDLVMFLLRKQQRKQNAEKLRITVEMLNDLLDKAGRQWVDLNPLCTEVGIRKLRNLQVMNDLDAVLEVFRCVKTDETNWRNYLAPVTALLNFWTTKTPTVQDNLAYWCKLADYRTLSARLFEGRLHSTEMEEDNDDVEHRETCAIREKMRRINIQLRLDIADVALYQKHQYIAENLWRDLTNISSFDASLKTRIELLKAKIECLRADIDAKGKMDNYTASWKLSHQLLNESNNLDSMNIAIRQHIGALALKIESLIQKHRENQEFVNSLTRDSTILRDIGIIEDTGVDLNRIKEQLFQHGLKNLLFFNEHATATSIGEHYHALARHCYSRVTSIDVQSEEIFRKFLLFTLKSMQHGFLEATHYFPCLLRPEQLQNQRTRETFAEECAKLQPWLFLRWRDLLFSHLATSSIASMVSPIVEKLAESYPHAVVYTYYLTIERNPHILKDTSMRRIKELLCGKTVEYDRFLQAIQYVAQPDLYLKHYLNEMAKDLPLERPIATETLLQKLHSIFNNQERTCESNPRPGDIYKDIYNNLEAYKKEIQTLDINDRDAVRETIARIRGLLIKSLQKIDDNKKKKLERNKNKLKYYSPFLHEYAGGDMEVPGQYSGDREPLTRYHAKIARFEPGVLVMQSLRRPIRIGIIGDNGKEYKFLVKFGEDLTIDHGLQQLFTTMNRTLRNDVSCRQRHLIIDTYEVIPLSRSFGLIQWIENTKSLEDLVQFTLSDTEKETCRNVLNMYAKWISDANSTSKLPVRYKEAVAKYSQSIVINRMKTFINLTPQRALREAFVALSPTWECFVTLRRNFVASYGTMCAAHWLAGVGDRHLQNTLVHVATGRCLGIDFGHAFGNGIRAPIPELVPFRLTPQMLELLRPFTERDLLATIMTHAMRALREDRGPILACMDIFVHKPVKRSMSMNDDENVDADLTWSSKRNIEIVTKKLNGIHPSFITLEQLEDTHNDKYLPKYRAIVTGKDECKEARASSKENYLTPAEQVDCLLDQATDLNVLGRMYANWQPWL